MQGCAIEVDANDVALVTFDLPGKVNVMNDDFMAAMEDLTTWLEEKRKSLAGLILTSAKHTFFAGGDLALMARSRPGDEAFLLAHFENLKSYFRRIERLGIPVVAAINGTALGGGYELCLACHRRIAMATPGALIGLPEVTFGILPAAGGVIRLPHILGLLPALSYLVTGRKIDVQTAFEDGLVDQIVASREEMLREACDWIARNPTPIQPWDRPREYGIHQLSASERAAIAQIASYLERTVGRDDLAARKIAEIAIQTLYTEFDTISHVETRSFVELVLTDTARERISAFFARRSGTRKATGADA